MGDYDPQKAATARYNKKTYDRISITVHKGQRQKIKDFAASQGKSLNRFICEAIYHQMGLAVPSRCDKPTESDRQEE